MACHAQYANDVPYIAKLGNEIQMAYWTAAYGSPNAAITALVARYGLSTNYSVRFNAGLYTLTANTELPANFTPVFDAGAVVAGAYGLGLNRSVVAPEESQVFNVSVSVTNRSNAPMNARWFGFSPGSVIGNSSYLTAALGSSKNVYVPAVMNSETEYTLDGNVTIPAGVVLDVRPGAKIGLAGYTLAGGSRVRPAVHLMGGGSEDPIAGAITGADNGKVDVYSYFTVGGGVFTNLLDAITQIDTDYPTTNRVLFFKTGTYPNVGDVTVPSRFQLEFDRGANILGSGAFVFSNPVITDKYNWVFDIRYGLSVTNASNARMSACWFGATPDNNADDDATELIAMNNASRNFYIPRGSYFGDKAYDRVSLDATAPVRCFIELLSNSTLCGDGPGQSIITMSVAHSEPTTTDIVHIGGYSQTRTNITIHDLSLNGTNTVPQTAPGTTGGTRGLGTWGYQIKNIRVYNCNFESNTFSGCAIWGSPGITDDFSKITGQGPIIIDNCHAQLNEENGFNIVAWNVQASNCSSDGNFQGWEVNGGQSTYANCRANGNYMVGFGMSDATIASTSYYPQAISVVGCQADWNGSYGISVNGKAMGFTITGCTANNNGQRKTTSYAGICVYQAPGGYAYAQGVAISGCTALGNYRIGIMGINSWLFSVTGCVIGNGDPDGVHDTTIGISSNGGGYFSDNVMVGTVASPYEFATSNPVANSNYPYTYTLSGGAVLNEASRSLIMGLGTLSGNGPDARFVSSAGGTNSTVTLKNLASFASDAPITVATGHSFNVGAAAGQTVTRSWVDGGGTTYTLTVTGGVVTGFTATPP